MFKIYNTFTNKEEEFIPINAGTVGVYTCGPTVYGRPHIGNYSSFLMADLLVRWLEATGYQVTHVKNITDVGHLAGDATADATGEDKIERQAKKEAKDPLEIAAMYTQQYIADEQALAMREPECRPKATETISEMLTITKELLAKDHAYETQDGYYFSVESFPNYGKLSGNVLENMQSGARIAINSQKRHPADFALWKKCIGENSHHILRWSFESGQRVTGTTADEAAGFPGWHIECSAMSKKCLGEHVDIHTGGEDNIFPHHECEIAQSESVFGAPFSKYWLHRRRIDLGDTKMSKSLGNTLNLDDIAAMGYSSLDLRYYLLSVHYRTQLKFTKEGLKAARVARKRIENWINHKGILIEARDVGDVPRLEFDIATFKMFRQKFIAAMNNDLNTPEALAIVFECMTYTNSCLLTVDNVDFRQEAAAFILLVQSTFACIEDRQPINFPNTIQELQDQLAAARLAKDSIKSDRLHDELQRYIEAQTLLDQRATARAAKNFAESDRLRDAIAALGFSVKDTASGQEVVES